MEEVRLRAGNIIWLGDEVRFRYKKFRYRSDAGIWNRMRSLLVETRIPVQSLSDVRIELHKNGGHSGLVLTPRAGACPFHTVAGGTIEHPDFNPLYFFVHGKEELIGEYFAEELKAAIRKTGLADTPAERPLIRVPGIPQRLIGGDGRITLNRDTVTFEFNQLAEPEKVDRRRIWTVPMSSIESVSWEPGYLAVDEISYVQVHLVGTPEGASVHPFVDINALLMSPGPAEADALFFAAALHERVMSNRSQPDPATLGTWLDLYHPHRSSERSGDSLELLKELAELRAAGVLTEDEFQAKKKEILDRL
ncbi:SHOCT domain-containing protein [Actinomadura pelletieri]|uniref:SHOCT domain-containing protein n=1 Tax=Actinomadura pelletieri TaxID=111805 RepID=UPI0014775379|nr:SHOCT domain-containing protein [Actinomadura pelletieri]